MEIQANTLIQGNPVQVVGNTVKLNSSYDRKFFIYVDENEVWHVVELESGGAIANGSTKELALMYAKRIFENYTLDTIETTIKAQINKTGVVNTNWIKVEKQETKDGFIKVPVLRYKSNGNDLTYTNLEIKPFDFPNTYTYPVDENHVLLIFAFKGIFVEIDTMYADTLERYKFQIPDMYENYLSNIPKQKWIQMLYIRLFELLEMDTTDLLNIRENQIKQREESKRLELLEKEEQYRINKENKIKHLNTQFIEFQKGKPILLSEFVDLCELKNIPIAPQTKGVINKYSNNTTVSKTNICGTVHSKNKVNIQGISNLIHKMANLPE